MYDVVGVWDNYCNINGGFNGDGLGVVEVGCFGFKFVVGCLVCCK